MSFEQIMLVGHLGGDPEMRYTPSGQAVTNFSLATNYSYTDGAGNKVETTTWWRVTCWGKRAEVTHQYLAKGRQVLVVARMNPDDNGNPRIWNRNDGTPAASYEITASNVRFLGKNGESQGDAGAVPFLADEVTGEGVGV